MIFNLKQNRKVIKFKTTMNNGQFDYLSMSESSRGSQKQRLSAAMKQQTDNLIITGQSSNQSLNRSRNEIFKSNTSLGGLNSNVVLSKIKKDEHGKIKITNQSMNEIARQIVSDNSKIHWENLHTFRKGVDYQEDSDFQHFFDKKQGFVMQSDQSLKLLPMRQDLPKPKMNIPLNRIQTVLSSSEINTALISAERAERDNTKMVEYGSGLQKKKPTVAEINEENSWDVKRVWRSQAVGRIRPVVSISGTQDESQLDSQNQKDQKEQNSFKHFASELFLSSASVFKSKSKKRNDLSNDSGVNLILDKNSQQLQQMRITIKSNTALRALKNSSAQVKHLYQPIYDKRTNSLVNLQTEQHSGSLRNFRDNKKSKEQTKQLSHEVSRNLTRNETDITSQSVNQDLVKPISEYGKMHSRQITNLSKLKRKVVNQCHVSKSAFKLEQRYNFPRPSTSSQEPPSYLRVFLTESQVEKVKGPRKEESQNSQTSQKQQVQSPDQKFINMKMIDFNKFLNQKSKESVMSQVRKVNGKRYVESGIYDEIIHNEDKLRIVKNRSSLTRALSLNHIRNSQNSEDKKVNSFIHQKITQLQNETKQTSLKAFKNFKKDLKNKKKSIEEESELDKKRLDPLKAGDLQEEFIDPNLELLLNDDELFENVERGIKQQKDLEDMNVIARILFDELKNKFGKETENRITIIKRQQISNLVKLFIDRTGAKNDKKANIEFLVTRFVHKLRQRVQEKKKDSMKIKCDSFVQEVLEIERYNDQLKNVSQIKIQEEKRKLVAQEKETILTKLKLALNQRVYQNEKQKMDSQMMKKVKQGIIIRHETKVKVLKNEILETDRKKAMNNGNIPVDEKEEESSEEPCKTPGHEEKNQEEVKEQKHYQKTATLSQFFNKSFVQKQLPLPILNKVKDKRLYLIKYPLNDANSLSFAACIPTAIPVIIQKLVMIDNKLQDSEAAQIFNSLNEIKLSDIKNLGPMIEFVYAKNTVGIITMHAISSHLLSSDVAKSLRKLHFKDLRLQGNADISSLTQALNRNSLKLNIQKLTISQINLSRGFKDLGYAIHKINKLESLDISSTGLNGDHLCFLLGKLQTQHYLKSLDISENKAKQIAALPRPDLIRILCDMLHHQQKCLFHLDISCMNFTFEQTKTLFSVGLRQARILISCHASSSLNFSTEQRRELLQCLKIDEMDHGLIRLNPQFKFQIRSHRERVPNSISTLTFASNFEKQSTKLKRQKNTFLTSKSHQIEEDQKMIFQRILGYSEVLNSNSWKLSQTKKCVVCNKLSYSVFVWNKEVQKDEAFGLNFYSRLQDSEATEPPFLQDDRLPKMKYPLIHINGRVQMMIPLLEFIERLEANKTMMSYKYRNDNDIQNKLNMSRVRETIKKDVIFSNMIDGNYWALTQQRFRDFKRDTSLDEEHNLPKHLVTVKNWVQEVLKGIPKQSYQAVNLQAYAKSIQRKYDNIYGEDQEIEITEYDKYDFEKKDLSLKVRKLKLVKLEAIARETFIAAEFLPSHHDFASEGKNMEIIIKHQDLPHIDYTVISDIPKMPLNKHLGLKSLKLKFKRVKKEKEVRIFEKPKSVWAEWIEDTQKMLDKAFETDYKFMKLWKFIKDHDDKENCKAVLKKHFPKLKTQFNTFIAQLTSYPCIAWLDFVKYTYQWGIIDKYLTSVDIDQIFIATNYEEEDLDNNDDSNLCRYEYMEIISRIAKKKFLDRGKCKTNAESIEKLITEFILPNTRVKQEQTEFRDDQIWCVEVDDIFKINSQGMATLYQWCKSGSKNKKKKNKTQVELLDCVKLLAQAEFDGQYEAGQVALAYSLSKMTIEDEMEEFKKYSHLKFCEFHDFIARISDLLHADAEDDPLAIKIGIMLDKLFKVIIGKNVNVPDNEQGLHSESDDEDELVQNLIRETLNQKKEIAKNMVSGQLAESLNRIKLGGRAAIKTQEVYFD